MKHKKKCDKKSKANLLNKNYEIMQDKVSQGYGYFKGKELVKYALR